MANQKFRPRSNPTPPRAALGSREEADRIRGLLAARPRDLLLFDLATQSGLAMTDLLALRVRDLTDLAVGQPLPFGQRAGGPRPWPGA